MKAAEVHKFSADEIKVEATRLRRRLFDLRTQSVTEKIEDTSQFRKTHKDLARVLTELNGRKAKVAKAAKDSAAAAVAPTATAATGAKAATRGKVATGAKVASAAKKSGGKS